MTLPIMNKYYHILVKDCRREQEEDLTQFCFDAGALGVSENLSFEQNDPSSYEPKTLLTQTFHLEVFFSNNPGPEFFIKLKKQFQFSSIMQSEQESKDWLEEWKKGYEPFPLGKDIWVVPHWCQAPMVAKKIIWMEPGMAFGTGTHETTQLVAQFLIENSLQSQQSLLDVGTGSALLAILAAHLGVQRIVANDIDSEALRVASENVLKNKVENTVEVTEKNIDQIDEMFDWVVANIIDGVLIEIQKDLLRCLKPHGHLIVSGILETRWSHFEEHFIQNTKLKVLERKQKGEWLGVLLHA